MGSRAWQVATDLARAGVVTLDCRVDGVHLGQPLRWRLTAHWQSHRQQFVRDRAGGRDSWQKRAEDVAARVADTDPGLAVALTGARTHPGQAGRPPRRLWTVPLRGVMTMCFARMPTPLPGRPTTPAPSLAGRGGA